MIITFTNVIGAIRNAISSVITTNLKIWLGFETSSIDGDNQITPDKSGNNNVGKLFTGKALDFNGSTDNVAFTFTTPVKSAVFWVKPLGTGLENILTFGGAFGGTKSIRSNSNVISSLGLSSVSVYVNGVQSSSVPLNQWSRVVVNFASVTPSELKFGFAFNSYGDIQLSDVQLYNENLSTDDITYDYANPQKLVTDRSGTSIGLSNLKGYWHLSEGAGSIAYDSGTKLGAEEITDGNFPIGTAAWSKGIDTTIGSNEASFDGTASYVSQNILVVGKIYECSVRVKTWVSGAALAVGSAATGGGTVYKEITRADNTTTTFTFTAVATTLGVGSKSFDVEGSIDLVSVKEVISSNNNGTINGATYEPAQPRIPQLGMMNWSKGSNSLTYSNDFSEWTRENTSISTSQSSYFNDTITKLKAGTSNTRQAIKINVTKTGDIVFSVIAKASVYNVLQLTDAFNGTYFVNFNLANGTVGSSTGITGSMEDYGNGFYRCIGVYTSSSSIISYRISIAENPTDGRLSTFAGNGSDGLFIYSSQVESGNSVSAYRLTDGAATLNSTVIPNPTIPTKDIFGNSVRDRLNSLNLDGSGYAEVAEASGLDVVDFSIEAWVKFDYTDSGSSTNVIYVNGGVSTSGDTFALATDEDNKVRFIVANVTLLSTTVFSNNNWVHIAGTRESNAIKLYINGNKTPEATGTSGATVNNALDLLVGRDTNVGDNRFYKERISDVRLYSSALSATEVRNNYNAGLSAHTN